MTADGEEESRARRPFDWVRVWTHWIPVACGLYPLAWIALTLMVGWHATLRLGHWPLPYQDDPSGNAFAELALTALVQGVMGAPFVFALGVVACLAVWFRHAPRRAGLVILGQCLTFGLGYAYLRADPANVIRWLMD